MPQGDGTGPAGAGPMTGRGLGQCSGSRAGFARFGQGRGGRRFMRRQAMPAQQVWEPTKEEEMQILEQEQKALNKELEEIKKRLGELKKQ
ncbi:DUF5320 domain-containing protein [Candidatus Woesearchaeota archaeon]|nr:DUF5320 domain-containing protein [Candidatus Woesearchaeota archaeon]